MDHKRISIFSNRLRVLIVDSQNLSTSQGFFFFYDIHFKRFKMTLNTVNMFSKGLVIDDNVHNFLLAKYYRQTYDDRLKGYCYILPLGNIERKILTNMKHTNVYYL